MGCLDGWRVSVIDAKGMVAINDVRPTSVSVVDTTTIDLDGVSTLGMSAHTADSGALKWYAPKDLSGYTGGKDGPQARSRSYGGPQPSYRRRHPEIDAASSSVWFVSPETALSDRWCVGPRLLLRHRADPGRWRRRDLRQHQSVTVLPEITTST